MPIYEALGILPTGDAGPDSPDAPPAPITTYAVSLEMYLEGAWVDVSHDVLAEPGLSFFRGIMGSGPTDRVARTGTMAFLLNNSNGNSGGLLGYYSPDNANCRTDFGLGTLCRLVVALSGTTYYKFYGRIVTIEPAPGQYLERSVSVMCTDYMDMLAANKLRLLSIQTSTTVDAVIDAVVDAMPVAPLAVSYASGPDTLAYALNVDLDERTTSYTAIQKAVQTDLGYVFVRGDTTGGETLTYQTRHTRATSATSSATLTDTMNKLNVIRSRENIYNDIRVTTYPVFVDGAATTVLFTLQQEFAVAPGATITKVFRYTDPGGAGTRVSGTNVAISDQGFSATPAGVGTDLNASMTIVETYGANSASFVITNGAAVTAYCNTFELQGKGVYPYDPVESVAADSASQTAHGLRTLTYNMPYQQSTNVGEDFAAELLRRYKNPYSEVGGVGFIATPITGLLDEAISLDIGDRITIAETVTGISADYFINAVALTFLAPDIVTCLWTLEQAVSAEVWILDTSALNTSTILGF